jgi:hypothetical protein
METSQSVDTCSYGCMQTFQGVSWAPKRKMLNYVFTILIKFQGISFQNID